MGNLQHDAFMRWSYKYKKTQWCLYDIKRFIFWFHIISYHQTGKPQRVESEFFNAIFLQNLSYKESTQATVIKAHVEVVMLFYINGYFSLCSYCNSHWTIYIFLYSSFVCTFFVSSYVVCLKNQRTAVYTDAPWRINQCEEHSIFMMIEIIKRFLYIYKMYQCNNEFDINL